MFKTKSLGHDDATPGKLRRMNATNGEALFSHCKCSLMKSSKIYIHTFFF